jgi:hypothetical protein
MANQTPTIWNAFCQRIGLTVSPCPSVSLWPDINATAQQFSDGVADFVAAPYNNGAITYVEYGYAKQRGYPVASILNKAGYYTQPTPQAVAIALKTATLNADLTQNLGAVYTNPDPNTYPVSSYSYLIVPTTTAKPFSTGKGTTLSKFILYMVCAGQQKAAQLGYSPLPKNLVLDAFNVVKKIPGHVEPPPITQCDNPTLTNQFAATAPPPPATDKAGGPPPPSDTPTVTAPPTGNQVQTGTVTPVTSAATAIAGSKTKGVKKVAAGATGSVAQQAVDGGTAQQALVAVTAPITPPSPRDPMPLLLYVVAAIVALIAIFGPPALAMYLRKPESP